MPSNVSLFIPIVTAVVTAGTTFLTMYIKDISFQKKKENTNFIKEKLEKCYTPLYIKLKVKEHFVPNFVSEEMHEIISKHGHYLPLRLLNQYADLVLLEKRLIDSNILVEEYSNKADAIEENKMKAWGGYYANNDRYQKSILAFKATIEHEYKQLISKLEGYHILIE